MNWRNAKHNKNGSIDVEIQSNRFGWIPFTAEANDKGAAFDVSAMVAEIEAFGVIAPYVEPVPVPVPVPVVDPLRDLSPKAFAWLLAFSGLGDVWDALELRTRSTDRASFALLKSERLADVYRLDVTLALVAQFRTLAQELEPEIDLSDNAIKAAWLAANEVF
jgi:hypothetical protein